MKSQYKRIDVTTIKGIEAAEKLHAAGWKIVSSTFWTIIFERNPEA